MKHLDLFSGIGGFALACSWVWGEEYENVGHSEVELYACKVYHRHFPESECLGDITKINWAEGQADLITGGFPCQPHSLAGKRRASADERDLWGECVRAIRTVRPRYALLENVPDLLSSERGGFFNRALSDLAAAGYDAWWEVVSACAVGAPHTRERVWIVAHPNEVRWDFTAQANFTEGRNLGNNIQPYRKNCCHAAWVDWETESISKELGGEPLIDRKNDGLQGWVDRDAGLGNAIVPQVAFVILDAIRRADAMTRSNRNHRADEECK